LNNYTSNVSLTLNSIINKNNTQDTSINNILITLPSYLQSATAASTYQPIGDYVVNNTLNNYTSNVSLTLNSIINKNDTQDTSINNILITLPSYLQSATAASTYQPIGDLCQ
jgi:2-keto-4-pentenoate hydratase/2-oxohepta-3-ene-1,7-dioic acid hydratase in catechol pathway